MRSPTLTPVPSNSPTISIPPHWLKNGVFNKKPTKTPAFVAAVSVTELFSAENSSVTDTAATNAGVFVGFLLKTPFFNQWGGMDIVGEFDGTGVNVGLRIPLTSDYRLNLGFTHIEKLPQWGNRYWSGHPAFALGISMIVPRDPLKRIRSGPSSPTNIYGPGKAMHRLSRSVNICRTRRSTSYSFQWIPRNNHRNSQGKSGVTRPISVSPLWKFFYVGEP